MPGVAIPAGETRSLAFADGAGLRAGDRLLLFVHATPEASTGTPIAVAGTGGGPAGQWTPLGNGWGVLETGAAAADASAKLAALKAEIQPDA